MPDVIAGRGKTEARERFADERPRNFRAEHLRAPAFAKRDAAAKIGDCSRDIHRGRGGSASELEDQIGGPLRRWEHAFGIDSAFEPVAGIADQAEIARRIHILDYPPG